MDEEFVRSSGRSCSARRLTIARRLGDPAALAYALDSRHVVLCSQDHVEECRALADEMQLIAIVATSAGRLLAWISWHEQVADAAELGRREEEASSE